MDLKEKLRLKTANPASAAPVKPGLFRGQRDPRLL